MNHTTCCGVGDCPRLMNLHDMIERLVTATHG